MPQKRKKPEHPTSPPPEAVFDLDGTAMRTSLETFLQAVLATCLDISKSEKLSDEEFVRLARLAVALELNSSDVEHLSERARRTLSARIAWASVVSKRRRLATEDPERAAFVDGMLFDTVMAASYLAQMGEDRVQFMENTLELRDDREARSDGGIKSGKSRAAWHAEAEQLFKDYRRENPDGTVATRIRDGMNRRKRIQGSSQRMLLKLIRGWVADEREKKDTELVQVS